MTTGSLRPLVRELRADPRVVDEVVAAARTAAPEIARLPDADTRRHVTVLLDAGLAVFERLAGAGEPDFGEAERLGADRAAQGIPLAALLCGVRAGRTRVFEIAIERGRAAGIPHDDLLTGALALERYAGAMERHLVDGYHAAERRLARDRADAAARLLRRLLLRERAGTDPDADELARFGLHPGARYHCLVYGDPDAERPPAHRCDGLLGAVEGRIAGLTPRPPGPAGADPATLLVFTPPVLLSEAADAYRLCVAAWLAAERFGRRGVHAVTDLAGETVLGGHPDLAGLLRDSLLDRLRPADAFHRELASTGLSYLDHGQRLDQTAAALHVHPNTVRYRLRRLHDLTGAPADADQRLTVLETLRWWWALHTWLTSLPPRGSPTPMRRSPPGSAGPTSSGWSTRDS
ncbi:helix-turn-helix domain-containing protein [Virgisporangium aurantiacum]|uniref:PucR C-terminal helix-turn-helix domain-containing protein n=1 Tax=Virgisporangium aurantiacum TaxID=175570 RepID=A0A8J4E724_9ACTN|nr:helix-turn-helix domain-containing protein [Virgisporangium aurantiacum]GIJ61422.1 hypothetical protein Vau01_089380 [Virgisporangium aurantiacum]